MNNKEEKAILTDIRVIQENTAGLKPEVRIEALAQLLLKYPAILKIQGSRCYAKHFFDGCLMNEILDLKHLVNKNFEGGEEFMECLNYAVKCYGTPDKVTGKLVPFLRYFNYLMQFKKKDIAALKINGFNPDNYYLKQKKLIALLGKACLEGGADPKKELKEKLSQEKVMELLEKWGASDTVINEAEAIMLEGSVIYTGAGQQQEKIGKAGIEANKQYLRSYQEKQLDLNGFFYVVDEAMAMASNTEVEADMKPYLTLKLLPIIETMDGGEAFILEEYLDKSLVDFVRNEDVVFRKNQRDTDAVYFAAFLDIKYDSARKRLNKVKTFLQDHKVLLVG